VRDIVSVKFDSADEVKEKIMSLCLKQCESQDRRNLLRIGSALGDFANNLRSSLNYTMQHYADSKIKPVMTVSEYKNLKRHLDFPWSNSKTEFDTKSIIIYIRNHDNAIYQLLEQIQPYHSDNEWLRYLMQISNRDKHEVINEIGAPGFEDMAFLNHDGTTHDKPGFFGDKLLVTSDKRAQVHLLPCYYYPYGAFASKEHRWILFFIMIDQTKLGLTRFIENVPQKVERLVNGFNTLL
jgi:hypothetical protein